MTASIELPAELEFRFADGTSLNAMGWNTLPNGDQVHVQAQAKGSSFGNPVPLRRALRTAMLDGSRSALDGHDNRTFPLALRVTGPDGNALAGVETPLFSLAGQSSELVWRPGDLASEPAVFLLDYADLSRDGDPGFGDGQLVRDYTLQVAAQPFTYSDEYVTIPALAQGVSTRVPVDDCSSLTGWSATGATLSLDGGDISAYSLAGVDVTVTRTGAVDLTSDVYLAVALTAGLDEAVVEVQGTDGAWIVIPEVGSEGSSRLYDATAIPDPTITAIRFTYSPSSTIRHSWRSIDKQATTSSQAKRSQVRTLAVPGSARTPASLLVESATSGLGTVLLYTGPAYNPGLMRGAVLSFDDATSLSGEAVPVLEGGAGEPFEIPAAEFFEGDHSLWVQAKPATPALDPGQLTITRNVLNAAGVTIASEEVASATLSWGSADYAMFLLGSVDLPGMALPAGSTATVQFVATWVAASGLDVTIGELLAFNRTLGDLTIAEASASKKMWLDSATLTTDRPTVYVGDGDKADAVPLSLLSQLPSWPGAHEIEAPVTYLYTGTTGADDAEVSGTFRPAWFLHPAV